MMAVVSLSAPAAPMRDELIESVTGCTAEEDRWIGHGREFHIPYIETCLFIAQNFFEGTERRR